MEKEHVALITDDRYFVKVLDDKKEIDIDPNNLHPGDTFAIYSDKEKKTKCHWDESITFVCEGPMFKNEDGVSYIQSSVIPKTINL